MRALGGGSGAVGSFDAWVRANWRRLFGIARVIAADPELAEDVLQDALADVYPRWEGLVATGDPTGYLCRVMASKAANHRRTSWARRVSVTSQVSLLDGAVADGTDALDLSVALVSALRELPPRQRTVVAMHYLLDMSVSEIATHLDVPTGSVTSDLTRGRRRLHERLGGERV